MAMYSMIDDEITHIDEEIERLDREIYEARLVLNSAPRINAPGVRTRNAHGVERDTKIERAVDTVVDRVLLR